MDLDTGKVRVYNSKRSLTFQADQLKVLYWKIDPFDWESEMAELMAEDDEQDDQYTEGAGNVEDSKNCVGMFRTSSYEGETDEKDEDVESKDADSDVHDEDGSESGESAEEDDSLYTDFLPVTLNLTTSKIKLGEAADEEYSNDCCARNWVLQT